MSAAAQRTSALLREDLFDREVINGVEYLHPRPALRHAAVSSRLGAILLPAFDRVFVGGPEGPHGPTWWILDEPELHLQGDDPIIPDLAGWRVARVPRLPDAAACKIAPDWLCEVLSPSTEDVDRAEKLPVYAEHGVGHVWLADPLIKTLEIYRLDGATYRLIKVYRGSQVVQAEPFGRLDLNLGLLWPLGEE